MRLNTGPRFAGIVFFLLLSAGPAYAACTNPAGVKGEFVYNDDYNTLQFCDGTDWIGMSGGSGGGGGGSVTDGDKGDVTVSGSGASWMIDDDVLNFTEFSDTLSLDASTDIAISGSQVFSLTNTGTANSFVVNDQASDTTPFVIDAAGNVGIGLVAPTQALDVAGKATATALIVKATTGAAAPTGGSSPSAQWTTDGTHVWRATGNVGIGTASPATKFHVSGQGRFDGSLLFNDENGNDGTKWGLYGWDDTFVFSKRNADFTFNNTYMAIKDGGNVGIGTTSPTGQLHVHSTGGHEFQFSSSGMTSTNKAIRLIQDNGASYTRISNIGDSINYMSFQMDTGNVGVGTIGPLGKLHVLQPTACCAVPGTADGAALRLDGPSPTIEFYDTDNGTYWINHNQSDTLYWHRWNGSSWVVLMNLTNGGYLSTAGGGVWSDIRLKKDIKPLEYGLETVLALKPISYKWKDKSMGSGTHLGLIAQDVEKLMPELVRTDTQTDMAGKKLEKKSVDYAALTAPLIRAVQEQQKRIETLEAEIEVLKAGKE